MIYSDSRLNRLTACVRQNTRTVILSSFIGRISDIDNINKRIEASCVLNNSKALAVLAGFYQKCKEKIMAHFDTSKFLISLRAEKNNFRFLPIRIISIAIITALLTNLFFAVLLKEEIELFGWYVRIIVLLIGIAGLFCANSWQEIRERQ